MHRPAPLDAPLRRGVVELPEYSADERDDIRESRRQVETLTWATARATVNILGEYDVF